MTILQQGVIMTINARRIELVTENRRAVQRIFGLGFWWYSHQILDDERGGVRSIDSIDSNSRLESYNLFG